MSVSVSSATQTSALLYDTTGTWLVCAGGECLGFFIGGQDLRVEG